MCRKSRFRVRVTVHDGQLPRVAVFTYDLDICRLLYILYRHWIILLFSGAFGGPGGSSNPDEDPDLTMLWFSFHMLTFSHSPSTPPALVLALHQRERDEGGLGQDRHHRGRQELLQSGAQLTSSVSAQQIQPHQHQDAQLRAAHSQRVKSLHVLLGLPSDRVPPTLVS